MRSLVALLLWLPAALAAEGVALLVLMLAEGPLDARELVAVLGCHVFASAAAGEALSLRYRRDDPGAPGAWRLGLALPLLLPGFGLLVTAVLALRPPRSVRVRLDDFISPMEQRKKQAEAELAEEAGHDRADVNVEAIGDALKDQDKAKRLGAVEALRVLQNKQAVELLNKSLKNTVFEVRYHAVEALAGINKKYSERIAKATSLLERDPSPERERTLGEVYYEYAALEMEEASIQHHLYRNAAQHLGASLQGVAQPDPVVLVKTATCLERLGEVEQAFHAFRRALEQEPGSFEALLGIARLHFQRGEYDQLRDTCRRILDLGVPTSEYAGVLMLWAEGPGAIRGIA